MAELQVVRQIKNSFNTLSQAEITPTNNKYIATTVDANGNTTINKNAYATQGLFDFVTDTADSVSMLADTSNMLTSYINSVKDTTLEGEASKVAGIGKDVLDKSLSYANKKIQKLVEVWNTKVDMTIETLIGDIAPFASGFDKLGENLYNRFTRILGVVTGTNISEGDDFGSIMSTLGEDYMDALTSDGSLNESISQLTSVMTVVQSLNMAVQVYKTVTQIRKIYEGVANTLSIASSFASSFMSGGVTAVEGVNTTAEVAQIAITKLRTLLLYTLKKFIFPIKIKVPMLLVGNVDSLSVRAKMMSDKNSWYNKLFDSSYYDSVQYTKAWANSIKQAKQAVITASAKVQGAVNNWSSLFENTLAQSYMQEITVQVRKTVNLEAFPKESITRSQETEDTTNIVDESSMWNASLEDMSKISPIINAEALVRISAVMVEAVK